MLEVIKEMPIDEQTADRLFRYGFYDAEHHTVGEVMERALEEDIKDVLHESGASYRQIKMADIEAVKQSIGSGASLEDVVNNIATDVSKRIVPTRTR